MLALILSAQCVVGITGLTVEILNRQVVGGIAGMTKYYQYSFERRASQLPFLFLQVSE